MFSLFCFRFLETGMTRLFPRPAVGRSVGLFALLLGIGMTLLPLDTAVAQTATVLRSQARGVDSTLVGRYTLAESYLRAGQFDRAIALLEDLYDASPATYAFYDRLKEAYESVKRYDDAIALVDTKIEQSPQSTLLLSERARILYLKGDEAGALAAWDATLDTANDPNRHRIVYNAMADVRLLEQAAAVLERGRVDLNNPMAYQTELAYLHSLTGQHEKAVEEYIAMLTENQEKLSFVRNRLSRFMEQAGALEASIAACERAVRQDPLNRAHRELLAWLYTEAEDYQQAFNAYRAIDRLEKEDGRVLFTFAQRAADAGAYDVASKAYDEVLQRHPNALVTPQAQMGLGEMHERWAEQTYERVYDTQGNRVEAPHYEAALDAYRTFLQQYPTHDYFPEVLRRIAGLQQDVFFNFGEAEATLQEITERYPTTMTANHARYDLGRIALSRGNLDAAGLLFSRLVDELRLGELAELARYEQALIHFYKGELDAASTLVSVLDENTSTDVANDAIELKVLIASNPGPDSLNAPLVHYAEAALQIRQRRPTEALGTLDALIQEFGQHSLADDARFLRAEALEEAGRTEEALSAFGELPLIHPDSPLADRALFQAAHLQWRALGDIDAALETYTRLLTQYPGSLLVPDARQQIRRLRGDADS